MVAVVGLRDSRRERRTFLLKSFNSSAWIPAPYSRFGVSKLRSISLSGSRRYVSSLRDPVFDFKYQQWPDDHQWITASRIKRIGEEGRQGDVERCMRMYKGKGGGIGGLVLVLHLLNGCTHTLTTFRHGCVGMASSMSSSLAVGIHMAKRPFSTSVREAKCRTSSRRAVKL